VADARNEIMAAHYMQFTGDTVGFTHIMQSNTTEEAIENIENEDFFNYLCEVIKEKCSAHIRNATEIEIVIFSQVKGLLGKTVGADEWMTNSLLNPLKGT
jgi:cobalt-precorrin-5B (C1)-methyltransferase